MKLRFSLLLLAISTLTFAQDTLLTNTAWYFKKVPAAQVSEFSSQDGCSQVQLPYHFTSHNLFTYNDTALLDGIFLQDFMVGKVLEHNVYILSVDYTGNKIEVFVNNEKVKVLEGMSGTYVDVSQRLVKGKNTIQLRFSGSTHHTDLTLNDVKIVSAENYLSFYVDMEQVINESALEGAIGVGTRLFASSKQKGNYLILHTLYAPDGKLKGQRSIKVKQKMAEKNAYYTCKPLKVFNPEVFRTEGAKKCTIKTEILLGRKILDSKKLEFSFN